MYQQVWSATFWPSQCIWVTFYVSTSLVCYLLTKSMYLSYLLCINKFGLPPASCIWVIFYVSTSLVCHLLPVVQSTETSRTKSVFLPYRFQRDVHPFLKFRITFTLTKFLEKSLPQNQDFPFTVRNEFLPRTNNRWLASLCHTMILIHTLLTQIKPKIKVRFTHSSPPLRDKTQRSASMSATWTQSRVSFTPSWGPGGKHTLYVTVTAWVTGVGHSGERGGKHTLHVTVWATGVWHSAGPGGKHTLYVTVTAWVTGVGHSAGPGGKHTLHVTVWATDVGHAAGPGGEHTLYVTVTAWVTDVGHSAGPGGEHTLHVTAWVTGVWHSAGPGGEHTLHVTAWVTDVGLSSRLGGEHTLHVTAWATGKLTVDKRAEQKDKKEGP